MKILYSGPIVQWSTTQSRLTALRALGHDVQVVDLRPYLQGPSSIVSAVQRHLAIGRGIGEYNRELIRSAASIDPDLIWLDTGAYVRSETIQALRARARRIVSYNSDYLRFRPHSWRLYLAAVPLYDAHVTTNELNRPELERRGARQIIMTLAAYDPALHRPPALTADDRSRFGCDVSFLGHCEPAYERALLALERAGLRVRVWGPGWNRRGPRARLNGAVQHPSQLWGPDSVKAMAAAKMCIGLVSHRNRNQSTGRSFEVPAVGGFLLAERTREHQHLYEEGKEAEFFSDLDELAEKARRYLSDEPARTVVAEAGHRRCVTSGGTHLDRVRDILASI